jgi:hypothetical protein
MHKIASSGAGNRNPYSTPNTMNAGPSRNRSRWSWVLTAILLVIWPIGVYCYFLSVETSYPLFFIAHYSELRLTEIFPFSLSLFLRLADLITTLQVGVLVLAYLTYGSYTVWQLWAFS